jgi:hypothetical protein
MESVKRRRADSTLKDLGTIVATEAMMEQSPFAHLFVAVNRQPGPEVAWDDDRQCYGLRTRQSYRKGEAITEYGGRKSVKELHGDYVVKSGELYIDGQYDFKVSQKGRWINESDRDRTIVNVVLGRIVRAACDIPEDAWLFADYGPDFVRNY